MCRLVRLENMSLLMIDDHAITHSLKRRRQLAGPQACLHKAYTEADPYQQETSQIPGERMTPAGYLVPNSSKPGDELLQAPAHNLLTKRGHFSRLSLLYVHIQHA